MKRTAILLALCGTALCLGGCDWLQPTVTSPFSGKSVTEGQLVAEVNRAEADAKAKATEAADKAAAAVRAAKATMARAGVEASLTLAESSAITDAAQATLASALAEIRKSGDAASEAIEAKRSQWLSVAGVVGNIPGVKQLAGSAGFDVNSLLTPLLGGGLLYQANRGRKQRAEARKEAVAEHKATVEAEWKSAKDDHTQQLVTLLSLLHPTPVVSTPAATPPGV